MMGPPLDDTVSVCETTARSNEQQNSHPKSSTSKPSIKVELQNLSPLTLFIGGRR